MVLDIGNGKERKSFNAPAFAWLRRGKEALRLAKGGERF
jgi:hypothetical protein